MKSHEYKIMNLIGDTVQRLIICLTYVDAWIQLPVLQAIVINYKLPKLLENTSSRLTYFPVWLLQHNTQHSPSAIARRALSSVFTRY